MELQAVSSVSIDAIQTVAGVDLPSTLARDVRPETPRAVIRRMAVPLAEEMMVPDQRAGLTPAQSVERKLSAMLRGGAAMPVSHYRLAKLCRKS